MKNTLSRRGSLAAIDALDLEKIKMKLMLPVPEGKGWTEAEADVAEKWYKRFLALMVKYPDETHVPNGPIDAVWHAHILDTRKYAHDCEIIFGEFIHHYPYFGLMGDVKERDDAFDRTNQLYRIEFGEDCTEMFSSPEVLANSGAKCGHAGSGTGCGQGCGKK